LGLESKHKTHIMNNFKDLEEEVLHETPIPLGIKSNVQGQLGSMRTVGGIVELYLSKIFDLLIAMFGGTDESDAKTHLVRLFVPNSANLDQFNLLDKLKSSLDLSTRPTVHEQETQDTGVEFSMKISAKDAAQFKKIQNRAILADMQIELR